MPIGMITLCYLLFGHLERPVDVNIKILVTIITLFTVAQSLFWMIFMDKTRILPYVTGDLYLGVSIGAGYKDEYLFVSIPFCILYFTWGKKRKKYDYGYYK